MTELLAFFALLPGWAAFAWVVWLEIEKRRSMALSALTAVVERQSDETAFVWISFRGAEGHESYRLEVLSEPGGIIDTEWVPFVASETQPGVLIAEFAVTDLSWDQTAIVLRTSVVSRTRQRRILTKTFYISLVEPTKATDRPLVRSRGYQLASD